MHHSVPSKMLLFAVEPCGTVSSTVIYIGNCNLILTELQ